MTVFEKVAEKHNTTVEQVKAGILFAMFVGKTKSPEMWENIHGTLEEQILHLASLSLNNC